MERSSGENALSYHLQKISRRTPSEQRLIDSEKGIVGGAKKAYINDFMGKNGILIIAVLAVIVFYKKIV
jgi:hypothetical protein